MPVGIRDTHLPAMVKAQQGQPSSNAGDVAGPVLHVGVTSFPVIGRGTVDAVGLDLNVVKLFETSPPWPAPRPSARRRHRLRTGAFGGGSGR